MMEIGYEKYYDFFVQKSSTQRRLSKTSLMPAGKSGLSRSFSSTAGTSSSCSSTQNDDDEQDDKKKRKNATAICCCPFRNTRGGDSDHPENSMLNSTVDIIDECFDIDAAKGWEPVHDLQIGEFLLVPKDHGALNLLTRRMSLSQKKRRYERQILEKKESEKDGKSAIQKIRNKRKSVKASIEKTDEKLAFAIEKQAQHEVIRAFILFENALDREIFLWAYEEALKNSWLLRLFRERPAVLNCLGTDLAAHPLSFHGSFLRVEKAPEPSNILWENIDGLEKSVGKRTWQKYGGALISFFLLIVSFFCVSLTEMGPDMLSFSDTLLESGHDIPIQYFQADLRVAIPAGIFLEAGPAVFSESLRGGGFHFVHTSKGTGNIRTGGLPPTVLDTLKDEDVSSWKSSEGKRWEQMLASARFSNSGSGNTGKQAYPSLARGIYPGMELSVSTRALEEAQEGQGDPQGDPKKLDLRNLKCSKLMLFFKALQKLEFYSRPGTDASPDTKAPGSKMNKVKELAPHLAAAAGGAKDKASKLLGNEGGSSSDDKQKNENEEKNKVPSADSASHIDNADEKDIDTFLIQRLHETNYVTKDLGELIAQLKPIPFHKRIQNPANTNTTLAVSLLDEEAELMDDGSFRPICEGATERTERFFNDAEDATKATDENSSDSEGKGNNIPSEFSAIHSALTRIPYKQQPQVAATIRLRLEFSRATIIYMLRSRGSLRNLSACISPGQLIFLDLHYTRPERNIIAP